MARKPLASEKRGRDVREGGVVGRRRRRRWAGGVGEEKNALWPGQILAV